MGGSAGERGTHYIYEPGMFVPLAQYVAEPVVGIETSEWKSSDRYVPEDNPLQRVPQRRAEAQLFYYHCDQIGTRQLLTDDNGDVVWEAPYKAWGEAREVMRARRRRRGSWRGIRCGFRGGRRMRRRDCTCGGAVTPAVCVVFRERVGFGH
ncbi:hypothetical protein WT72_10890 [Burkholderia pseudomultivorans]|nr:hypothetical protein WT72_10890 [Burkholderia pseudomultivorans]